MRVRFLKVSQIELEEAIQFYEHEIPGLGATFLTEVVHTLNRIAKYPEAWQPFTKRTRRCQTRRFPYGVIYQIRKDEVLIIAVANLHRKPDYWKGRT